MLIRGKQKTHLGERLMYLELSDLGLHSGNVVNVRFKLGERLTDNADAITLPRKRNMLCVINNMKI